MRARLHRSEHGFTLIEILVVMLILGILAAIALPQFIGQTEKAQDADAKSLARTLQTHVSSCFTEERDWTRCDTSTEVTRTRLTWGTNPGQVQVMVRPYGQNVVAFAATSETRTLFAIVQDLTTREVNRICFVPSNAYPTGACRRGGPFAGMGLGTW
jgi:prepilin-type N-terminal cleavage/methylation domain-containing protein